MIGYLTPKAHDASNEYCNCDACDQAYWGAVVAREDAEFECPVCGGGAGVTHRHRAVVDVLGVEFGVMVDLGPGLVAYAKDQAVGRAVVKRFGARAFFQPDSGMVGWGQYFRRGSGGDARSITSRTGAPELRWVRG